ncbi:peptidoglycan-binding protein [Verrucomicrobia bacterium IMCC26134]|jgi:LysM repeat protein|nr:peptidoglycan-binding protein [Verrucomicrobia bacterium IMCC26134]
MWKVSLCLFAVFTGTVSLWSQGAQSPAAELASLREDIRLLQQRTGELSLRVEQLEADNSRLSKSAAGSSLNYVTLVQLNEAVADLTRVVRAGDQQTKTETLALVSTQIEKLAVQTNAALDSVTKPRVTQATNPATPVTFTENFSKEGISYTVVSGDTLSRIAQKTGAKVTDIINANRIADPSRVQVGQVLFIPGGK